MTIYIGEEQSPKAKRLERQDLTLTIARAHKHHCDICNRDWYCWCWQGEVENATQPCLVCYRKALLPKVRRERNGVSESYCISKLFSHIEVSQGGWSSRWVTTRELRAALSRWIRQEYEANPPEVTEEAGSYQCGGCRFFLALDSDYGICANVASPYDGRIVFEHVGCKANPWYLRNHQLRSKP